MFELSLQKNNRVLVIDDTPTIHDDFRKILLSANKNSGLQSAQDDFFGSDEPPSCQASSATRLGSDYDSCAGLATTTLTTPSVPATESAKIELDTALQGREGVWKAREACSVGLPYALAFVDMRMPPGWDGLTTIECLWDVDPNLQVVICTAYNNQSWSEINKRLGQSDRYLILKKPFDAPEILQLANALIEKWNLTRQRQEHTKQQRLYAQRLEQEVQHRTQQVRVAHEETIHRLVNASMFRDEETGSHIRRVGLFSEVMARSVGWGPAQAEELRLAAPMHDVGKIGIPDRILRKPGKLSVEEFDVIKTHTTIGAVMLEGSDSPLLRMASEIALQHHERWDGSGYPHGIAGEEIAIGARIVSIVDVYDALTHDRVYRPAMCEKQAIGILRQGAGTHHDPELLDLFMQVLPQIRDISAANPDEDRAEMLELWTT